MTIETKTRAPFLPHHRLVAWEVGGEFLLAIRAAGIRDAKLREQAMRAAVSVRCNIAEAASRTSVADKARVFGIARGECGEAVGAVETAVLAGCLAEEIATPIVAIGGRLYALLTGLIRKA